ncbi:chemotaxis-specific protein-glutamate methyltransferase CheB [Plastoroseomonas hellenica]|uniref:chemotaxis-specific protein-glutamate methyltransferase CheB n=1 Tax=Plastoroseomonas hellenica TaxID=2687306 RepID=UPI001BA7001D|nr:chemotaxis-specific protein-glutamate methyltransferase CheB [Plastoroseomonas hellenica]
MIKLLIVDDSALMRRVMGQVFQEAGGYVVEFARDGVEALAKLHAFRPDVVTLDVQMPRMDGLRCLDRIMVERPCAVLMVSSLTADGADATLEALELGAFDFVPKPDRTVSLVLDELAPILLDKVRAAAASRVPRSHRLAERLRARRAALPAFAPAPPPAIAEHPTRPGDIAGAVIIGTSTGGPPALEAVLTALPGSFPWPVLVAQHMPAAFTASLARRLDAICALRVVEVTGPMPLHPGNVYVARGDADMTVSRRAAGPIVLPAPASTAHRWHPSVDRLVASAMAQLPPARLIGVLMTGMGNDGAASMAALRIAGGRTIAEAEETAVVWGMPGELVRMGGAEQVAPLDAIAARLMALAPV